MRRLLLTLLPISLPASAYAQVSPGDLLLNSVQGPDMLVHYRPDGTVLQTTGSGTGSFWEGAAILPNGNWATTRRSPNGVNIFDGVTGIEVATWDLPSGFDSVAGDMGVFSDGTLAIVDQGGGVWRLDTAGNVIANWTVQGSAAGILVDDQDHVWTCDAFGDVLWRTDDMGNKINEFPVGGAAGDVTMAEDGTLFVTRYHSGEVAHFAQDGAFLGAFVATSVPWSIIGIAMGADQTLWVTGQQETKLLNFDQAGSLLGSFDVGPATSPLFLTVPVTGEDIGMNYCGPANPNSTGQSAAISAFGSTTASFNILALTASLLPVNVFGYFLNSDVQGFRPLAPGSQGNLCLGGAIGRHAKQIANSGAAGELVIDVDLTALPRPNGTHSVVAGETWNFQFWFRDNVGGPTSNFTDAIEIVFN